MAKVLTRAQIIQARDAVDAYVTTTNSLYQNLESTFTALTSTNWTGDGSDGSKSFFTSAVTPALTDRVTDITKALRDILDNCEQTFLDRVDPDLGEANKNPGGGA